MARRYLKARVGGGANVPWSILRERFEPPSLEDIRKGLDIWSGKFLNTWHYATLVERGRLVTSAMHCTLAEPFRWLQQAHILFVPSQAQEY